MHEITFRTQDHMLFCNGLDINICYYMYREKIKDKNKNTNVIIDFLGYLSYLKYILNIEESIKQNHLSLVICMMLSQRMEGGRTPKAETEGQGHRCKFL